MNQKKAWERLTGNIRMEQLTDDMRMVAQVIGIEGAVRMCRQLGGLTIHIPTYGNLHHSRDGTLLLKGTAFDAVKLARELGGVTIRVPMIKSILYHLLPDMVRMEYNGSNLKALAVKYGISQRTAQGYVHGRPTPQIPGQVSMFENK